MWGILVALLSGALMSLQGIFNTEVTKQSSMGGGRMGAADGVSDMCGSLFFYRAWGDLGDVLHRPEIYASRRCHGRVHHLDRDKKHGRSGTG